MARISFATKDDLPEGDSELLESLSPKEGLPERYHHLIEDPVRNIYRTVGRIPPLLVAFREFGRAVWDECRLTPRQRELVILTTARTHGAAYEWHQHVRVALSEGLSTTELSALSDSDHASFSTDEQALIEFATKFARQELDRPTFDAFVERFDEQTAVGVGVLVGLYTVIALIGSGFDLETEEPFVGWGLAGIDA
jgi:alkylhydroperoxidase family enzyme